MRGLAEATGAHVWFADPDDLLAEGSLAAVADRLERDRPDVLLLDYRILRPGGGGEPSPGAALLAGSPGVLTLAARPALIDRTMTLWSKVFRRAFVTGLGVAMPPGIHEDVPLSATALLKASRIALLGRVCYLYRRRPGSFLATASMDHFGIFASYARVFAALEDGAPAAVRAAVFGRMLEHYSSILANGLVPRAARRQFFGRMAADFRRYRPTGYRRPARLSWPENGPHLPRCVPCLCPACAGEQCQGDCPPGAERRWLTSGAPAGREPSIPGLVSGSRAMPVISPQITSRSRSLCCGNGAERG